MSASFDIRNLSEDKRRRAARHIQKLDDVRIPHLNAWNYDLCRKHRHGWVEEFRDPETGEVKTHTVTTRPKPGCRKCGIHLRAHQRVGSLWLYYQKDALLANSVGTGKSQPLSEPVLTPTGWRNMGDLVVGDRVIGSDGKPCNVIGVYPQKGTEVVRVNFNDGTFVRCSPDHLWEVQRVGGTRKYVLTAQEMQEGVFKQISSDSIGASKGSTIYTGVKRQSGTYHLQWSVPQVEPVEFDAVELSHDPYLLGVFLGDGSSRALNLNKEDSEAIISRLRSQRLVISEPREASEGGVVCHFRKDAVPLELENLRSWDKYIPQEFLVSSVEDRLALLQGLLDTDGSAMKDGGVEFSTTSPMLRDGVVYLTQSLGGIAREGKPRNTKYTHKGEVREGRESYRVNVKLPAELDPFSVPRKLAMWKRPTKYPARRLIKSIVPDTPEATQCIAVDAPDQLYVTRNFVPTHNTSIIAGLLALMVETGELGQSRDAVGRAIIVPRSPALLQWRDELQRMVPGLQVSVAIGTKEQRTRIYQEPWDVLLIGPEMLTRTGGEADVLKNFKLSLFVTDDIDSLRNPDTNTSYWCDRLGRAADRYVITSATPLQKRLMELHAVLDGLDGVLSVLGSRKTFEKMHVKKNTINGKEVITGYRDVARIKRKIAPYVMRKTAKDISDVTLPTIISDDIMLELYPQQRRKYKELQKGIVALLKEDGNTEIKHTTALSKLHYGAAICAGLSNLGEEDGPASSVKFDWIMDKLGEDGDLEGEKVVIFANLKESVRALQRRLTKAGIGFVTVWGENKSKEDRRNAQEKFWNDPECKVLLGTRAIEQSLNLQVARHLINVDMILNPARMEQLAGRIRRDGSAYQHVYVHNLLAVNTQEERYLPMLERESALADFIWDDNSQLFKALQPHELLRLISG